MTNPMKFNEDKCQILHLGQGNPGCMDGLENEMLERSAAERDLGALVDRKLRVMEGLKFTLVEYINISLSPCLQPFSRPIQVPLNSSLAFLRFDHCFVPFVLSKLQIDKPNSLIYSIEVHELDTFTILQPYSACESVPLCMHTHPHRWLRKCNN